MFKTKNIHIPENLNTKKKTKTHASKIPWTPPPKKKNGGSRILLKMLGKSSKNILPNG